MDGVGSGRAISGWDRRPAAQRPLRRGTSPTVRSKLPTFPASFCAVAMNRVVGGLEHAVQAEEDHQWQDQPAARGLLVTPRNWSATDQMTPHGTERVVAIPDHVSPSLEPAMLRRVGLALHPCRAGAWLSRKSVLAVAVRRSFPVSDAPGRASTTARPAPSGTAGRSLSPTPAAANAGPIDLDTRCVYAHAEVGGRRTFR